MSTPQIPTHLQGGENAAAWKERAERAEAALERLTGKFTEIAKERDSFWIDELARVQIERDEARVARNFVELAANKAEAAQDHMCYCRSLLNVPRDEVLADAIKELQAREAAMRLTLEKIAGGMPRGLHLTEGVAMQACAKESLARTLGLEDKA